MKATINTGLGPTFVFTLRGRETKCDMSPVLFSIIPARGEKGDPGPAGRDGDNFKVSDVYPTLAELRTAFPTGDDNAYQVTAENNEIFIWSERLSAWTSIGPLLGPKGDPGAKGSDGKSAYDIAVEQGYTGTEEQFGQDLAEAGTNAAIATQKAQEATQSASEAASSATTVTTALTNYYTKLETDNMLGFKANANDVYTKSEADNLLADKPSVHEVYTQDQTDNLLSAKLDSASIQTGLAQFPATAKSSTSDVSVVFPTPFASGSVPTVIAVLEMAGGAGAAYGNALVSVASGTVTNTGFTLHLMNATTVTMTPAARWIAIGTAAD